MPPARQHHFHRYDKIAKTALPHVLFNTLFSRFHEAHPTNEQNVFLGRDEIATGNDWLSRLPSEIFDLILIKLSTPALDAARYVCRSWRAKIMNSAFIIDTVVGSPSPRGQLSDMEWLRLLLQELDSQSDLVKCWNHPDTWRTRYRQCNVSFHITNTMDALPPRPISAVFCVHGASLGHMVTAAVAPSGAVSHTMIIYQFSAVGQPQYVGSIICDEGVGAPRIVNLSESSHGYAWNFDVWTNTYGESYSIRSSSAIVKGGSPFTLRMTRGRILMWNPPVAEPSCFPATDSYGKELEALCTMPSTDTLVAILPGNDDEQARSLVLAKRAEFGQNDVYLLYTTVGKRYTSLPIAQLCPPRADVVLRNITFASLRNPGATILVAIVWQECSAVPTESELYIYEIPNPIQVSISSALPYINLNVDSVYTNSLRQTLNHKQRGLHAYVSGKRIRSLDGQVGGVHPSSPLWRYQDEQTSRKDQAALGGLAILQTNEKAQLPLHTKATHLAIYVWGPNTATSQVNLSIYDFTYANHNLEQLPWQFYGSTDSTWYRKAVYNLRKRDPQLSEGYYDGILCQCALHDDGYTVMLPNIRRQAESVPTTRWSVLFDQKVLTVPASVMEGSIEHYNSPARARALARRDEWLRERIAIMKRAGLDNDEVAIAWHDQRWTRNGVFDMPDNWKNIEP
ncbi:MAG: hypothetical protein Q9218_004608 [Villophora microphyllina]